MESCGTGRALTSCPRFRHGTETKPPPISHGVQIVHLGLTGSPQRHAIHRGRVSWELWGGSTPSNRKMEHFGAGGGGSLNSRPQHPPLCCWDLLSLHKFLKQLFQGSSGILFLGESFKRKVSRTDYIPFCWSWSQGHTDHFPPLLFIWTSAQSWLKGWLGEMMRTLAPMQSESLVTMPFSGCVSYTCPFFHLL